MTDTAPGVPRLINISRWLWIIGGTVGIIRFLVEFTDRKGLIDRLRQLQPDLDQGELDTAANSATLYSLFFAAGLAFVFIYLAQRMASGNSRARLILAILAGVGIFFNIIRVIVISTGMASALGFAVSPTEVIFSVVSIVVETTALILMFQPSVAAHFQRNRAADTVMSVKS